MYVLLQKKKDKKNSTLQKKSKLNNTGIPTSLKNQFEAISGFSFDDVKIHYNSNKPAQLQALAYTQGNQVYISSGQEKHLKHELGHVVQQKQGIVKATNYINNVPINDDLQMEDKADHFPVLSIQTHNMQNPIPVVQRYSLKKKRGNNNINDDEYIENCFKVLGLQNLANSDNQRYKDLCICILTDKNGSAMINSKTEKERYEEVVTSGGGGYDSSDNTLYVLGTSDGSYDRRAILHELGHFKQYLNQDVQENFSPKKMTQENQRLNLLEFHNIILHENFYQPRTELPLENIKCSYKKDTKGDYYRITYLYPCIGDLRCSLSVRQGLTDVENRLATEILGDNGLKNSIYDAEIKMFGGVTTKIRAMLINALLKFCGNYFEKAQT